MRAWIVAAALTLTAAGSASAQTPVQPDAQFPRPESSTPVTANARPSYYLQGPVAPADPVTPAAPPADKAATGSMWTSSSSGSAMFPLPESTDPQPAPFEPLGQGTPFETGAAKICTGEGAARICK